MTEPATTPAPPRSGQQLLLPDNVRFDIKSEENAGEALHRRWRETSLFVVALGLFTLTFLVTGWFAFLAADTDADTRKAALGIFITLAGALIGFLGGRASK
ncbi:hypothetical protein IP88_10840 [alpha proteobacterium AAP81b]|nr:hypothetical protein IP88_10840 [alpha proteobacterium AAP81b]